MTDKYLILVGPTRTGTTSLFRFLSTDKQSFSSASVKETNFFLNRTDPSNTDVRSQYNKQFVDSTAEKFRVEASPLYFTFGGGVGEQIRNALPVSQTKILVTLREPVARFVSLFDHAVTKRNVGEALDFEDFLSQARNTPHDFWRASYDDPNVLAYAEGLYLEALGHWLNYFPRSCVRVAFHESLTALSDRGSVLAALYRWLDLPIDRIERNRYGRENKTRHVKFLKLHRVVLDLNKRAEPLLNRTPILRNALRRAYYAVTERTVAPTSSTEELTRHLAASYAIENSGLFAQVQDLTLGPLPAWVRTL